MKNFTLDETVRALLRKNAHYFDVTEGVQPICTYSIKVDSLGDGKALFGLVDWMNNALVCEPRFTYVGEFVDGVAVCKIDERVGYVKPDASYLIEPTDKYVEACEPVDDICLLKTKEGKWKLFSCSKNDFITTKEFDKVEIINKDETDLGMAMFIVYKDNVSALIRKDGTWVISFSNYRSFYFIERNIICSKRRDDSQSLFNVVTNEIMLDNAYMIEKLENGYFTYYDSSFTKCTFFRITDNKGEAILTGHISYQWFSNSLVACQVNEDNAKDDRFDIFNLDSRTFLVQGIDGYWKLEGINSEYWYFEENESLGVFDVDGNVILKCIADEIIPLDQKIIKVRINNFWGAYSLEKGEWIVLPQFIDVLGPDKCGFFRVISEEMSNERFFNKKVFVFRYIRENGQLLTRKKFSKASQFSKVGYARVVTLDGRTGRLSAKGQFSEDI